MFFSLLAIPIYCFLNKSLFEGFILSISKALLTIKLVKLINKKTFTKIILD